MSMLSFVSQSLCKLQPKISVIDELKSIERALALVNPLEKDDRIKQKTTLSKVETGCDNKEYAWDNMNTEFSSHDIKDIPGTGKTFYWKCKFVKGDQMLNDELTDILSKIKNLKITLPNDSSTYQYQFKINISQNEHTEWTITILLEITIAVSYTISYVMDK